MSILKMIRDWFSEHFSAATLKERLELAKDQNAILTDKVIQLENKILELEKENLILKGKIQQLESEKAHLDSLVLKLNVEIENFKKSTVIPRM